MSGPRDGSPTGPERGQDAALLLKDDDARKGRPTRDADARDLPAEFHAPTPEEQERMVEALLFASPEPLPTSKIAERLPRGCDPRAALARLQRRYEGRGVNLVRSGGAWAFRTAPDLRFLLSREVVETRKLSRAGIETLAIVAYHGPVTRTEIEEIRGVSVSKGTLDQLMELGWVRLGRRRETPGRPVTYVTTDAFLDHFALESAADLPNLGDLRAAGFLGDATVQEDLPLPEPDED
jgi:segregation and condensation protein B